MVSGSSSSSSSGGSSSGGSRSAFGGSGSPNAGLVDAFSPPEYTGIEKGIAWFKVTFGCLYVAIGLVALARLFYVRNTFEIKARSPNLVMLNGLAILGLMGVYIYRAGLVLDNTLPLDVEDFIIVSFFVGFLFVGGFLMRCLRLRLAYSPALRKRLPWLMSEKLLLFLAFLSGLAGAFVPLYRVYTINGPFSILTFINTIEEDQWLWAWILLGVVVVCTPLVWPVDDLFRISRELLGVVVFQIFQTVGEFLTDRYASVEVSYWINVENIPFFGGIIMFGVIVIDPLRRLAFNPVAKTYPALARANDRRREDALRALKNNEVSELTEPDSFCRDSGSASASATDMATPKRRKLTYESLAGVPELAADFRAFAVRALCQESVLFLEEVSRYQRGDFSSFSPPEDQSRTEAFLEIVARFIADGSTDEVNLSGADKKHIVELSRNGAGGFRMLGEIDKLNVFGKAYVEIRYMLETNLLQRFIEAHELNDQNFKLMPPPPPARRRKRRVNTCDDDDDEEEVDFRSSTVDFSSDNFSRDADVERPGHRGVSFASRY